MRGMCKNPFEFISYYRFIELSDYQNTISAAFFHGGIRSE